MKAKDVRCKECGGLPELHGQDHLDTEGPFYVVCKQCSEDAAAWAYPHEAWAQWKHDNKYFDGICINCDQERRLTSTGTYLWDKKYRPIAECQWCRAVKKRRYNTRVNLTG